MLMNEEEVKECGVCEKTSIAVFGVGVIMNGSEMKDRRFCNKTKQYWCFLEWLQW